jgi:hypothetical protein
MSSWNCGLRFAAPVPNPTSPKSGGKWGTLALPFLLRLDQWETTGTSVPSRM